jgi:hypothetical protein
MLSINRPGLMLALSAVVITSALFIASYASGKKPYFDPGLGSGVYPCSFIPNDLPRPISLVEVEDWFAQPLRRTEEPSLFYDRSAGEVTTLRLTFLPSWGNPSLMVRIEDLYGSRPRLVTTIYKSQLETIPGVHRTTRDLTRAEVASVHQMLRESRVLDLQPDACLSGPDGEIFVVETNGPDGYRFINRWSPAAETAVGAFASEMFALTGFPMEGQHPIIPEV